MSLTDKQQVFINEYLKCWNATEAARRAGYKHPNKQGPANLVKLGIREEIEARKAALMMSAEEVMAELTAIGRGDFGDFLQFFDGVSNPILSLRKAMESGKLKLLKKVKYKDGVIEFELYDRQRALEQIGKIHGLFTDKVELTWKDKLPDGYDPSDVKQQFINLMRQAATDANSD